jgi:hypothetical protein
MNPNTFIKNKGITQTYTYNKDRNKLNASEIDWDAEYDGNRANISVNLQELDGDKQHYDIQLDNRDLAQILSIPSINVPIDKRLIHDFKPHRKNKHTTLAKEDTEIPFYTHVSSPNIHSMPMDIVRRRKKTRRQLKGGQKKSKKQSKKNKHRSR